MSLFACTPLSPMSLFVTNFGYAPPPSPGDVFCEWLFSWILKFWWHVFLLWILSQTIMHIVIIILVWYRVSQCFSGVTNLLVKLIKMQKWKFFSCSVYLRTLKLLGRYLKRFFSKSPMFLFKISSLSLYSANSSADAGSNN